MSGKRTKAPTVAGLLRLLFEMLRSESRCTAIIAEKMLRALLSKI
jgi:hypothetical protein